MSTSRTRYGLALASAATLASLSCGALAGAAVADPGGVPHRGDHGKHLGQDKSDDKPSPGDRGKGHDKDHGEHGQGQHGQGHANGHASSHSNGQANGHANGQANGHANGHGNGNGNGNGNGHASAPGQVKQDDGTPHGNPPGNNGTVKIAAPGDAVGHPSNNPHPGCSLVVEWFGFDAGDDVVSTVSFAPQAPTSDVTIGGTSPAQVFVGGDAAGGGTDLDGRQAYTLTFTGDPHPKQGYHVKLTVATPHSLGNDTKTKVFWVEPCAPTDDTTTPSASSQSLSGPQAPGRGSGGSGGEVGDGVETAEDTNAVAGVGDADAAVPTAVDAGEDGSVLPDWARSPLPLVLVAGGAVLVAAAGLRRSRTGA